MPRPQNHVSHEAALARIILAQRHDGLLHLGEPAEHRFDLPQLDAKAADFDLIVAAPEELDIAVRHIACEIAGPVQARPRSRAEGIGDESLVRQLRSIQVTARDAIAADAEFPRHPDRHRLQVPVEDIQARVGDGSADGDRSVGTSLGRHRVHAASHYGFCGPVFIDEQGARRVLAPELHRLGP